MRFRKMVAVVVLASVAASVALVAGVVAITTQYSDTGEDKPDTWRNDGVVVFHAILADPDMYGVDGVYHNSFEVPKANSDTDSAKYVFDFVPSGSSPNTLIITLSSRGGEFEHITEFVLDGTRHEAGLGEFYTWEYKGDDTITLPREYTGTVDITIDPNGSTQGAVSVYLIALNDIQE